MIWALIPVVAILVGGFTEWLKFKEKQLDLGNTTKSLAGNVDSVAEELEKMRAANDRLAERIKNLETIVTTQAWDDVVEKLPASQTSSRHIDLPDDDPYQDEERARILARRLKN